MKINVKNITRYSSGCPTQWDGETTNGGKLYIRYRWGCLTVDLNDKEIFNSKVGDEFDGVMSDEDMKKVTGSVINWI